jgi:hypothetical protein
MIANNNNKIMKLGGSIVPFFVLFYIYGKGKEAVAGVGYVLFYLIRP